MRHSKLQEPTLSVEKSGLHYDEQNEVIEAFNSLFRYLDDLLIIDNPGFEDMVTLNCPPDLQINKAGAPDTDAQY